MRRHLTYANVISSLCLFIVLGGGAYAAVTVTGKDVRNSSLTGVDIRNSSLTSSDVRNGSLLARDFRRGQLPSGPTGPQGPQGPEGRQGAQGIPGPFPDGDLPSGKTLRGTYGGSDFGNTTGAVAYGAISFGFRLASAPAAHFRTSGSAPTAECPGNSASPEAGPGSLCVYEGSGAGTRKVVDPTNGVDGATRYGAMVIASAIPGPGPAYSSGTWAVTAP